MPLRVPSWTLFLIFGVVSALIATQLSLSGSSELASSVSNSLRTISSKIQRSHTVLNAPHLSREFTRRNISMRTPVYFIGHGGPNLFEDTKHPAFAQLQQLGREITSEVEPKAVVVLSAHWQGEPDRIEVNTAESLGLIYDFYGFPAHYYEHKYPNHGSPELASRVLALLKDAGIKADGVRRGLDHGVYSPFTVAFDPKKNPLSVPIVQVSLYDNEDPHRHYALGRALAPLREEGILIMASGMIVHNLRDIRKAMQSPTALPYVYTFDEEAKQAIELPPEEREKAMTKLLTAADARKAHPTFEHLLPIHVAAGAAANEAGRRLWTLPEASVSWAMFRFGEVAAIV